MSGILRGGMRGVWLGALLLALAEMHRPGFLALDRGAGWAGVLLVLLPFAAAGVILGWALWPRRHREEEHSVRFRLAAWLLILALPITGHIFRDDIRPGRLGAPWRVFLLGLDGADWSVIEDLVERGELPNFERLGYEGATGVLRSQEPWNSPRVWTTIASGVSPDVHGALEFSSTQASIETARMWEVVNGQGGRIGVWGWLLTWPPGNWSDGFLTPGWLAKGPDAWPPKLHAFQRLRGGRPYSSGPGQLLVTAARGYRNGLTLPTLLRAGGLFTWTRLADPPDRRTSGPLNLLQAELSTELFLNWARRAGPDFAALVLYATDSLAHQYWKDYQPERFGLEDPPHRGRYAEVIPDAYRQADRSLGRLMDLADERTVVAVVSGYGTGPRERAERRYTIRPRALVRALGAERRAQTTSLGNHLLIRPSHWRSSEEQVVPPFVVRLLEATVDGERLFEVRPTDPPYFTVSVRGMPNPESVARFGERVVPVDQLLIVSEVSGMRTGDGILGLWGAPIRRETALEEVDARDVAPTLLALLGCPLSEELEGRVLEEALNDGARQMLRINTLEAYGPPPHRRRGELPPTDVDEALSRRIEALGSPG